MCRVRSRCLISSAVSKPSMPGIWTSSRMTAKSSAGAALRAPRRPSARARAAGRAARGSPRARRGSRAGRRRAGCWPAASLTPGLLPPARRRRGRAGQRPISASGEHGVGLGGRERGGRHLGASALAGSCTIATPPRCLIRARPARPVVVRARQHARRSAARGTRRRPTRRGRRSRAARSRPRSSTESASEPPVDQQVVVRRGEVDVRRLDRLACPRPPRRGYRVRVRSRSSSPPADRVGAAVLRDDERRARAAPAGRRGARSTARSPPHDAPTTTELVHRQRTFR